jgi:hypothetical protein
MSVRAEISIRSQIAGRTIVQSVIRDDGQGGVSLFAVPAGLAGTLTTRTDGNTGIITLAEGHGITTSDLVSVFWPGGSRYNMTVTSTTTTTISVDVGEGANFPTVSSAVVVSKQLEYPISIIGDNITVLALVSQYRCHLEFLDGSDTSLLRYDLNATEGRSWIADQGITNPLAGDTVAAIRVAGGELVEDQLTLGLLV